MGAGLFQGTAQSKGHVRNYDTQGVDIPFGSRFHRGYLREQLGSVLFAPDIGQERVFKAGLAFSLEGELLYDDGPGPFPHQVGGLAVNSQGGVATSTLTPETFLAAIGLLNAGDMVEEAQPAGLFHEPLFQGLGYNFASFSRATEGLEYNNGIWKVIPAGLPRFEENMLLMEPSRANKCDVYNFQGDPRENGISGQVEITLPHVPDLLARVGLTRVVPNQQVYQLDPFTSADTLVRIQGGTFSTNPHIASVFVNSFGIPVEFGIEGDRGIFTTDKLERVIHLASTPGFFDALTFMLKGSQRIQFVLCQLEEGTLVTSPIRCLTGIPTQRDRDSCKWDDPGS